MKRTIHLWILAFIITIGSVVYQRTTGPTYPTRHETALDGKEIEVTLHRSHAGDKNHRVAIPTNGARITGSVEWKRYNTDDAFTSAPMTISDGVISAELPHQPPAGKLLYRVILTDEQETFTASTVIRFRGDVPLVILLLHVAAMFIGMLLSTRTGLEVLTKEPKFRSLTDLTFLFLTVGGMILGPVVLKYAFDVWWTGIPFGMDITDNKTLAAIVAWFGAVIAVRRSNNPSKWIAAAAIVTLIAFLIPHSLWGTEFDYKTMQVK